MREAAGTRDASRPCDLTDTADTRTEGLGVDGTARQRQRAPYRIVGEAMRQTLRVAMAADLTRLEHRVLNAVLVLTASYSRTVDDLGTRQLASEIYGIAPAAVNGSQRR